MIKRIVQKIKTKKIKKNSKNLRRLYMEKKAGIRAFDRTRAKKTIRTVVYGYNLLHIIHILGNKHRYLSNQTPETPASLRRLQATPLLQTSLFQTPFQSFYTTCNQLNFVFRRISFCPFTSLGSIHKRRRYYLLIF